ncbi:hypothetical protein [Paenibacillus sp. PL2-23]
MKRIIAILIAAVIIAGGVTAPIYQENMVYAAKPNGGSNDPPEGMGG